MKFLDSSEEMKNKGGDVEYRDLVQFVAFKEMENDGKALCEKILAELPKQFMKYMKLKNKRPNGTLLSQFEIIE